MFDPAVVQDQATYADPINWPLVAYVLVNGQVVVDNGKFTPALPGAVLRR